MQHFEKILLMTGVIVLGMASISFAGSWGRNSNGWYYLNDDGSYASLSWQWIDGNNDGTAECYYFDNAGYLLTNTIVDGYQVNADGAWIEDGNVKTKSISSDGVNGSTLSGSVSKDAWKKAYIDFIESGKFYYDIIGYRTDGMLWDYAYLNDDDIPELMLICFGGDIGWVYSYSNGNILVKEGGQNTTVSYKSGGNLIYSTQETRHYQNHSYRIGVDGFQLIHSTMSYEYNDYSEYTVDGVEVTSEQYDAAMKQYFSEPGMIDPEYKYTTAEIIEIIKNL